MYKLYFTPEDYLNGWNTIFDIINQLNWIRKILLKILIKYIIKY